jgi:hypothetical protein
MPFSHSTRKVLAGACFALSAVWAVAGAFKLIFGVRITFPLLPPLDLERVAPVPTLAVAVGLMIIGAWLGRTRGAVSRRGTRGLQMADQQLIADNEVPPFHAASPRESSGVRDRPPSA